MTVPEGEGLQGARLTVALLPCPAADDLSPLRRWVSDRDWQRVQKMRVGGAAISTLGARVLLRQTLGQCLGRDPGALEMAQTDLGRPLLPPSLRAEQFGIAADGFSLSHCAGMAACAILQHSTSTANSNGWQVGIDVEAINPGRPLRAMAERVFHPAEYASLADLEGAALVERFTCLWTLKEAVSKAVGLGFALDFPAFCIENTPPRLRHTHPALGAAALWRCGAGEMPACRWAWAVRSPQPEIPLESVVLRWSGGDAVIAALEAMALKASGRD